MKQRWIKAALLKALRQISAPTRIASDSALKFTVQLEKDKAGPILVQLCWSKDISKARLQGKAPSFIRAAAWSSASRVSSTKKASHGVNSEYNCSALNRYINPVRQYEGKGVIAVTEVWEEQRKELGHCHLTGTERVRWVPVTPRIMQSQLGQETLKCVRKPLMCLWSERLEEKKWDHFMREAEKEILVKSKHNAFCKQTIKGRWYI